MYLILPLFIVMIACVTSAVRHQQFDLSNNSLYHLTNFTGKFSGYPSPKKGKINSICQNMAARGVASVP